MRCRSEMLHRKKKLEKDLLPQQFGLKGVCVDGFCLGHCGHQGRACRNFNATFFHCMSNATPPAAAGWSTSSRCLTL